MALGAGHATAAGCLSYQLEPKPGNNGFPLRSTGRDVGLLGVVRQQTECLGPGVRVFRQGIEDAIPEVEGPSGNR